MLNYAQIYAFCYAKFCGQNSPKKSLFQLWRLRAARCWSWSLRSSSPSKPSSGGWVFCYGLRGLHKARGVGPECYSISICLSIYLAIYMCVCVLCIYEYTYIYTCMWISISISISIYICESTPIVTLLPFRIPEGQCGSWRWGFKVLDVRLLSVFWMVQLKISAILGSGRDLMVFRL